MNDSSDVNALTQLPAWEEGRTVPEESSFIVCKTTSLQVLGQLPFQMVIAPLAVSAPWMQLFASACLSRIMPCFASSLLPYSFTVIIFKVTVVKQEKLFEKQAQDV